MKSLFSRVAAIAVLTMLGIGAHAAVIEGELLFAGQAGADPGPDFLDAIGVTFLESLLATGATGHFADDGIVFGSVGTINGFAFADTDFELLTMGSFTYTLASVSIELQAADFLNLTGTGTMSAAGFDDTPFTISLSADRAGSLYAFSGTLVPTIIPVPGALILLLSGLGALGIRRRS